MLLDVADELVLVDELDAAHDACAARYHLEVRKEGKKRVWFDGLKQVIVSLI